MGFFVMGFYGARKQAIMASNVAYALCYARASCIIVKDEFTIEKPGQMKVLVPVDTNKWSEKALMDAFYLTGPDDEIVVLNVRTVEDDGHKAQEYYTKLVDECNSRLTAKRNVRFESIRHGGGGAAD